MQFLLEKCINIPVRMLIVGATCKAVEIQIVMRHHRGKGRGKNLDEEPVSSLQKKKKKALTPAAEFLSNRCHCSADHNVMWPCFILAQQIGKQRHGERRRRVKEIKKRNAVFKKKNQRIGFEISTLEMKSKALSAAGLYFSVSGFHWNDSAHGWYGQRS